MSQEKSKTMPMQMFGGVKKVYYGICASSEWRIWRWQTKRADESLLFVSSNMAVMTTVKTKYCFFAIFFQIELTPEMFIFEVRVKDEM